MICSGEPRDLPCTKNKSVLKEDHLEDAEWLIKRVGVVLE